MRVVHLASLLAILAVTGCNFVERAVGPRVSLVDVQATPAAQRGAGAVYVLSNAIGGNAVLAFARDAGGGLGAPVAYPTGGSGTGGGLGSQGAVIVSDDGRWLFAVDAGSNEIASFRILPHRLRLVDHVGSGGVRPVSLAFHDGLLVALNAGGSGNLHAFRVRPSGNLESIAGSDRPLSSGASMAAQVGFTPDGSHLVVTERATNVISTYAVEGETITGPDAQPSSGTTPFGFGFDRRGTLVVSEAFGGAADASAVSSYRVESDGDLDVVSGSVPTTETSACWIAVSGDDRYAYSANTGSGTITGYAIGADGALTRLPADGVSAPAGMAPADLDFSADGRYLYVRNGGSSSISVLGWNGDGSLSPITDVPGLPAGTAGLAAR